MTPSPVALKAAELGIAAYEFEDINAESAQAVLAAIDFDAVAVVAYGQLLKPATLALAPRGWINLHFSLLPALRGAAPVQRAVMTGESITGVTTFVLDAGMDSGPIIAQMTSAIAAAETAGDVLQRLAVDGASVLVDSFDAIASGLAEPRAQSSDNVSYAPKLSVAEANIKWHHPALGISRWIRGCTPEPGAWTTVAGSRIEIGPVQLVSDETTLEPGECRISKSSVLVGTGSCALQLGLVKPAGKKWMAAADWARGLRETELRFEYV
jgi:methionyl-tRNA formyltransferase